MAKYCRVNFVDAKPMTRGAYNKMRGWTIPANGNPKDKGYVIYYRKGQQNEYVSWCPKAEFDAVSRPVDKLSIGEALIACVRDGKKIAREGWNGKNQFVRLESILSFENGQLALEESQAGEAHENRCLVFHYTNMKTGETGVQVGWLMSMGDAIANDWRILD